MSQGVQYEVDIICCGVHFFYKNNETQIVKIELI